MWHCKKNLLNGVKIVNHLPSSDCSFPRKIKNTYQVIISYTQVLESSQLGLCCEQPITKVLCSLSEMICRVLNFLKVLNFFEKKIEVLEMGESMYGLVLVLFLVWFSGAII